MNSGGDKISVGPSGPSPSTVRDTEIIEIRIKEINDKWRHDLEKLENEKVMISTCQKIFLIF